MELHTRSGMVLSSWNLPDAICHQSVPYRARQQPDTALPTPPYKITGISSSMITAHLDLSCCIILGAASHLWTNWTPDLLYNDDTMGTNNTRPYFWSRLEQSLTINPVYIYVFFVKLLSGLLYLWLFNLVNKILILPKVPRRLLLQSHPMLDTRISVHPPP